MAELDDLLADFLEFDDAAPRPVLSGPSIDAVLAADFGAGTATLNPAGAVPVSLSDPIPSVPLSDMLAEQQAADPDRLPWPSDWLSGPNPYDWIMCRRMWCAVLLTCIRDALKVAHIDKSTVAERYAASSGWIGSKDFHMVCALAGVDGVAFSDRLARIAKDPAAIARVLRADNLVRV